MKYGYIYLITNKINKKIYIGKRVHKTLDKNYWGSGLLIKNAIKKYGINNFERIIICWCENSKSLCDSEIYWIKWYRNNGYNLYNLNNGGIGGTYKGRKRTKEEKAKISKSLKGIKHSLEHNKNVSKSTKGIPHLWQNKKVQLDDGRQFSSIGECAKCLHTSLTNVSSALNGWSKTVKGHTIWIIE